MRAQSGLIAFAALALLAVFTVDARAQAPDTITAEGPKRAHPGDTVTYNVTYEISEATTEIAASWSASQVQFVAATVAEGAGEFLGQDPAAHNVVRWRVPAGVGRFTLVLQIPADFTGSFTLGAFREGTTAIGRALVTTGVYVPGTEPTPGPSLTPQPTLPPTPAATTIPPPTDSGSFDADTLRLTAIVLGGLGGLGLVTGGTLLWLTRKRR
jgi:hypothetical protein